MTELHLTDDQLAALVDESLADSERAFLIEHLRSCQTCHAAYRDTVRYRAILEADSSVFRAPDAMVELARAVARPARPHRRSHRWTWLEPRLAAGLSAAAVILTVGVVWYTHRQPAPSSLWLPTLKQVAATASADGSIVLPGVEGVVAATSPEHRTGFVQPDATIETALSGLTNAYRQRPNADVANWLISGYLATGELEKGRLYIQDARLRFPDDTRFLVLDAIDGAGHQSSRRRGASQSGAGSVRDRPVGVGAADVAAGPHRVPRVCTRDPREHANYWPAKRLATFF